MSMVKLATADRMAETRQQVLQAAIEVFAAEGYHETDVQVIADRAGVGKGTVYRHFGDKEKLFLAAAKHALEQMSQSIGREMHSDQGTVDYLRNMAVGCARYYAAHPEAVELIVQERAVFRKSTTPTHRLRHSEGQQEVEKELRRGIERGELRPIDVRATFEAFGDLLFGCIFNSCVSGEPSTLVSRVQHAMDIFFEGIISDSGRNGGRSRTTTGRGRGGL
jgi:AcrR family transcriptional regulator